MKTIGKRLKRIRMERGLTQKELASKVRGGMDYTYIGKIERGEQLPSLKVLIRISDALSMPISYFFQDDASAALMEIPGNELKSLLRDEKRRELLRTLRLVHDEDIPLITEIIKVLHGHRKKMLYETSGEMHLKAAEEEAVYRKRK